MGLLGEATYTRRRRDGGAWVAGRWVRGAPVDVPFPASVQRVKGQDRQVADEGHRATDSRKLITEAVGMLRSEEQHTTEEADEVLIDGVPYTVTHTDVSHPLIPHDVAILVRVQEGASLDPSPTVAAIRSAVRTWIVAMAVDGGLTDDASVIYAHEPGPRPPLPYLVIDVPSYDEHRGQDERLETVGTVGESARGLREGIVSLEGYGAGAAAWLDRASLLLVTLSSQDLLRAGGISLSLDGPQINLSTEIDTSQEPRYRQDYALSYQRLPDPTDVVAVDEIAIVEHTDHLDGSPDVRIQTVTETL